MFTQIKEFLFGKDPVQSPAAAPYKLETPAEVVKPVVSPVQETKPAAQAPAKPKAPKAPAKPRKPAEPKPKAAPKPVGKPKAPVNKAAK